MPWDVKNYISEVELPGGSKYYVKDADARDAIDKLSNATHFLGVTTTTIHDGDTQVQTPKVVIGSKTYAVNPTGDEIQLVTGDIVIATGDSITGSDEGTEYVVVVTEGVGSNTAVWYQFGSAKLNDLGSLAWKNSANGTTESTTLSASTIPVAFGSDNVDGATKITVITSTSNVSAVTGVSYIKVTGVSYDKLSEATVTVNSNATFTGTVNLVESISQGTITKNDAINLTFSEVTGGTALVTGFDSTTTSDFTATGGKAVVGSSTVYGLASAAAAVMTGSETLNAKNADVLSQATLTATDTSTGNINIASVSGETLTISALAFATSTYSVLSATTSLTAGGSTTATTYTVGASGETTFTQPTVAIPTPVTKNYKAVVAADTFVTSVANPTFGTSSVTVTVTGDAVTNSSVSFNFSNVAAIVTSDNFAADLTSVNIKAPITVSESYAAVSAYAGGSHTHDVTVS